MDVRLLRAKLHMARVTATRLHYHGSITIDRDLMDAAGLLPHEAVTVANLETGQRAETYVIVGERGGRQIELNGAVARMAEVGDRLIVMAFGSMPIEEAEGFEPTVVLLAEGNEIEGTA